MRHGAVGLVVTAAECAVLAVGLAASGWDGGYSYRRAKAASECRRCGLSPTVMSSVAALSGPTPNAPSSAGYDLLPEAGAELLEVVDVLIKVRHPPGQRPERDLGDGLDI